MVALFLDLPQELSIDLTPREVEGVLISVLLLLGVQIAWLQFSAPLEEPRR